MSDLSQVKCHIDLVRILESRDRESIASEQDNLGTLLRNVMCDKDWH